MTESYVLLTRPITDSLKLDRELSASTIIAPMLTVEKLLPSIELPPQTTDIIVTSPRVFQLYPELQSINKCFWCVGEITAQAARDLGITTLKTANGTGEDLLSNIITELDASKSYLVHLSGETLHTDIIAEASIKNFSGERIILYRTHPASELSATTIDLIRKGLIKVVAFYSYKSAETFANLLKKHEITDYCRSTFCLTLSQNIASAISHLHWKELVVKPDLTVADLQEYYMKDFPKKTQESKKPSIQNAISAAFGAAAALAMIGIFFSYSSSFLVRDDLDPILMRLDSLENQIKRLNSNDTSALSAQIKDLNESMSALKAQFEKTTQTQATNQPADTRLTQLVILEQTLQKLLSTESTTIDIENSLTLLNATGIELDITQKDILNKRPITTIRQLMADLDIQANQSEETIDLPLLDKIKRYVGDIKVKRVTKDASQETNELKAKIIKNLQDLDLNELNVSLDSYKDQLPIKVWIEHAHDYITLVQTLKTIKNNLQKPE